MFPRRAAGTATGNHARCQNSSSRRRQPTLVLSHKGQDMRTTEQSYRKQVQSQHPWWKRSVPSERVAGRAHSRQHGDGLSTRRHSGRTQKKTALAEPLANGHVPCCFFLQGSCHGREEPAPCRPDVTA